MSNLQGWISLHRKIQQSAIYPKRKFTKYEAWIDLLLMANHKDGQVVIGNDVFDIKRGQLIRSIRSLANKWKWSPNKVRRCLKMFEDLNQIRTKSVQKATQITVCNYESYQEGRNSNGTVSEHERNTNGTQTEQQRHTNNKDNKDNKVNNENKRPSLSEVIKYFSDNKQSTKKASEMYEYYENLTEPRHKYWRDKNDRPVKNWKNKARQVWFEDEIAEEHRELTKEEIIEQCISQLDAKIYIRQIEEKEKFKLDKVQLAKDYLKACEQHGKNLSPLKLPEWVSMNQLWIIDKYKPKS